MRRVEMISIGDELLCGRTTDTNATRLGALCRRTACSLERVVVVPDDEAVIAECLRAAASRAEVVVLSGGLGPTSDDLTRHAVALALGVDVEVDADARARLEAKFRAFGREMNPTNERQALFPAGAEVLPSEVGTADAFRVTVGRCVAVALPGVPREFRALLDRWVEPMLAGDAAPAVRTLHVCGLGESDVGGIVSGLGLPASLRLAFRADMPTVEVEISSSPDRAPDVEAAMERVREALAPWALPEGIRTPAVALATLLEQRGLRFGTAESCTGGLIASLLTDVPGASRWFQVGAVTYANEAKEALLDVPRQTLETEGAVSRETAIGMASGLRTRHGLDVALAVTGIAGPSGGTPDKPVGTVWLAVATADGVHALQGFLPRFERTLFKRAVAGLGMMLTRRVLEGRGETLRRFAGVRVLADGFEAAEGASAEGPQDRR